LSLAACGLFEASAVPKQVSRPFDLLVVQSIDFSSRSKLRKSNLDNDDVLERRSFPLSGLPKNGLHHSRGMYTFDHWCAFVSRVAWDLATFLKAPQKKTCSEKGTSHDTPYPKSLTLFGGLVITSIENVHGRTGRTVPVTLLSSPKYKSQLSFSSEGASQLRTMLNSDEWTVTP
jgi:hypothetical protein